MMVSEPEKVINEFIVRKRQISESLDVYISHSGLMKWLLQELISIPFILRPLVSTVLHITSN